MKFNISVENLIWLSGWLEGEGSFMSGPPSKPNTCVIAAVTTDLDIAEKVAKIMTISVIKQKKRKNDPEHYKQTYYVRLQGEKAFNLMKDLKSLMGKRRQEQIDKAMATFKITKRKMTSEKLSEINYLVSLGFSLRKIANQVSVDKNTVRKIKNKQYKFSKLAMPC
jgi:DNA-binding NarL/FixJ family response regulator